MNLHKKGIRPFILSRSTFPGSGSYAAHWTGDNWATWEFMRYSISGMMDMNMFGIPMVGANICGFFNSDDTKIDLDELCGRWHQLAAFYPLAQNHYNKTGATPHEAYNIKKAPFDEMVKSALKQRMEYLRYMYTKLFEASQFGGTVIRPLFFEFPSLHIEDNYDTSFLVGDALKVSPKLKPGNVKIQSPFPGGVSFIDLNNYASVIKT